MIPDTHTCPDCGCALDGTPTRPLAWCPLCQRWFTRYGDECTQAQLNRYTESAKTAQMPQHDISAQDTVKLRKVTTRAEQQVIDLLCDGGFEWEAACAIIKLRQRYETDQS